MKLASNLGDIVADTLTLNTEAVVDSMRASTANQVTINDNVTITGDLTVNGTSNVGGFWAAGRINGSNLTIISSQGTVGFTVTRPVVNGIPDYGVFRITFNTPHPIGNGYYTVLLTNYGNFTCKVWDYTGQTPTVNDFCVVTYTFAGELSNSTFYFAVLA